MDQLNKYIDQLPELFSIDGSEYTVIRINGFTYKLKLSNLMPSTSTQEISNILTVQSNIHNYNIPNDGLLNYTKLFKIIGKVIITNILIVNKTITSVDSSNNIVTQLSVTDSANNNGGGNGRFGSAANGVESLNAGWSFYYSSGNTLLKANNDVSSIISQPGSFINDPEVSQLSDNSDTFIALIFNNPNSNLANFTGTFDAYVRYYPFTANGIITSV